MRATLGLLFVIVLASPAFAQIPQQFQPQFQQPLAHPTISPYLQLLRNNGSNNPALNYYGFVQPQLQAQQNFNNLQTQIQGLQNASAYNAYPGTGNELATGKLVGNFTHRGYFLNNNGGGNAPSATLAGQIGTVGNNTIFQPLGTSAQQPFANNNSVMPYRR